MICPIQNYSPMGPWRGMCVGRVADDDVDSLQMFLDSALFSGLLSDTPRTWVRVTGQDLKLGGSHSLLPAGIFPPLV